MSKLGGNGGWEVRGEEREQLQYCPPYSVVLCWTTCLILRAETQSQAAEVSCHFSLISAAAKKAGSSAGFSASHWMSSTSTRLPPSLLAFFESSWHFLSLSVSSLRCYRYGGSAALRLIVRMVKCLTKPSMDNRSPITCNQLSL